MHQLLYVILYFSVTILDVNDNSPQLIIPPICVSITEFHEAGQPITVVQVSDADDPETVNGQVCISYCFKSLFSCFQHLTGFNRYS